MKKKLSDRIVIRLWGKKKKRITADNHQVKVEEIKQPMYFYSKEEIEQANLEDYMAEFEQQTGKHAVWRGEVTKQFLKWKAKNVVS